MALKEIMGHIINAFKAAPPTLAEQWAKWDDSCTPESRRIWIQCAMAPDIQVSSIDAEFGTGYFSSELGTHSTTLDKCDCLGFRCTDSPCAHMYRLAIELHLINSEDVNTAIIPAEKAQTKKKRMSTPRFTRSQARKLITEIDSIMIQMDEPTRNVFLRVLYNSCYRAQRTTYIADYEISLKLFAKYQIALVEPISLESFLEIQNKEAFDKKQNFNITTNSKNIILHANISAITLDNNVGRVSQILYFHLFKVINNDFNLSVSDLDLDQYVYHIITD